MKPGSVAAIVAALVLSAELRAAEAGAKPTPSKEPSKGVTLLIAGDLEQRWVDAVSSHLRKTLKVPIHERRVTGPCGGLPDEVATALTGEQAHDDLCAIALGGPSLQWPRINIYGRHTIALIGVDAYAPHGIKDESHKQAVWERRVLKESVRAACVLLGLPECPFPQCALRNALNDGDLDLKANTPCPPCWVKLEAVLAREGAEAQPPPR